MIPAGPQPQWDFRPTGSVPGGLCIPSGDETGHPLGHEFAGIVELAVLMLLPRWYIEKMR
jgi:hypothetical protein